MPTRRYPVCIDIDLIVPVIVIGLLAGLIIPRWLLSPLTLLRDMGFGCCRRVCLHPCREDFFVPTWNLGFVGAKNDDNRMGSFVQVRLRCHCDWNFADPAIL